VPGSSGNTGDATTIGTATREPLLTGTFSLDGLGGGLTLNTGGVLTIGTTTTTGTLNMGANSITLNGTGKISTVNASHAFLNILGGSITGTGTSSITGTGNISGWGTISVPTANATWIANTAGQALTFQGGAPSALAPAVGPSTSTV
jgi:autotransporter family porin